MHHTLREGAHKSQTTCATLISTHAHTRTHTHTVSPTHTPQRIIWGYKILMLDVLFPLSVKKIIYIDSDQTVRGDLRSLSHFCLYLISVSLSFVSPAVSISSVAVSISYVSRAVSISCVSLFHECLYLTCVSLSFLSPAVSISLVSLSHVCLLLSLSHVCFYFMSVSISHVSLSHFCLVRFPSHGLRDVLCRRYRICVSIS